MSTKPHTGRWQEFADARGIDAKYAEHRRAAEVELDETLAGPRPGRDVPPGDVDMKNPGGEMQYPSPMHIGPKPSDPKRHGPATDGPAPSGDRRKTPTGS